MAAPLKPGVIAVIADPEGRHLFIKRGLTLSRAPGWWCFVGGEAHEGEDLALAAAREVREEVGLRVDVHEQVHESLSPNGIYRLHWFRTTLLSSPRELVPHPVEVAEARWLGFREGLALDPILPGLKSWLEARLGG